MRASAGSTTATSSEGGAGGSTAGSVEASDAGSTSRTTFDFVFDDLATEGFLLDGLAEVLVGLVLVGFDLGAGWAALPLATFGLGLALGAELPNPTMPTVESRATTTMAASQPANFMGTSKRSAVEWGQARFDVRCARA